MFRGEIRKKSNLDIKTHYKATETFQSTHLASCHPSGVKHGFIKGEAIRLLRTNSPKEILEEGLLKFKQRFKTGGYLENIIERSLSGVNFASRQLALTHTQKPKGHNVHSAVKNLKQISMEHRSQPLLIAIFTKPPIISYTKRKSRSWEENIIWRLQCNATTKATWRVHANLFSPLFLGLGNLEWHDLGAT